MMETINLDAKYSSQYKAFSEDQTNYRLNEISKIKDHFNEEIKYQQSLTNKLSKYLTFMIFFEKF